MSVNPVGGSGKKEARDSACTPKWLADLIGYVQLDPCSNPRSRIDAEVVCSIENGGNGLCEDDGDGMFGPGCFGGRPGWGCCELETNHAGPDWTVFVNPPYARGQVIRWVRHYRHTRFIFLLRWDPSTKWCKELLAASTHVWFPDRRIDFEPPPGVVFSSNPFPHALFLRDPPSDLIERLSAAGYLFTVDSGRLRSQSGRHGQSPTSDGGAEGSQRGEGSGGGEDGAAATDGGAASSRAPSCGRASGKSWGRFTRWLQALAPEGGRPVLDRCRPRSPGKGSGDVGRVVAGGRSGWRSALDAEGAAVQGQEPEGIRSRRVDGEVHAQGGETRHEQEVQAQADRQQGGHSGVFPAHVCSFACAFGPAHALDTDPGSRFAFNREAGPVGLQEA